MPKNWKTYKLEELTTKLGDGLHGTPNYSIDGEYYFINGNNLTDGKIEIKSNTKRVTKDQFIKYQKPLNDRTIFVSINGTLGNVATYNNEKVVLGKSACYFNVKEDVYKEFIKQYVTTTNFKRFLENNATGSVIKNVSLKSMREHELNLPPLPEQKAIANILSAIDDKIENNLAINKTLEDMAMALYKHWFVDFGPFQDGEFVDSELGAIPKGWEVKRIKDFGNVVCGKTPLKKQHEYYESNDYPFIKIPDMHGNAWILNTNEYLSEKGNQSQIKKLLPSGSINVSCIATVGLVTINIKPSHTNQQINSIVPRNKEFRYYLYLTMINLKETFLNEASGGSATLNMNTSTFSRVELIQPKNKVISNFHKVVSPLFDKIKNNQIENQTLTKLRDTLLPKLISGEVRLKEFKEQIQTVL